MRVEIMQFHPLRIRLFPENNIEQLIIKETNKDWRKSFRAVDSSWHSDIAAYAYLTLELASKEVPHVEGD